jgi:hypothetical protein
MHHAEINYVRDRGSSFDRWTVLFFRDGERVVSGVSSPTFQLFNCDSEGAERLPQRTMYAVGQTGVYWFDTDESAEQVPPGGAVLVVVAATIDGVAREFCRLVGRDE